MILLLSMLEELVNYMFSMALGTSKQSLLWFSISMYEQNMKENSYKPSLFRNRFSLWFITEYKIRLFETCRGYSILLFLFTYMPFKCFMVVNQNMMVNVYNPRRGFGRYYVFQAAQFTCEGFVFLDITMNFLKRILIMLFRRTMRTR